MRFIHLCQDDAFSAWPLIHSWNFGKTDTPNRINQVLVGQSPVVRFDGNEWLAPEWPNEVMSPFLRM
jgi:hypothetical protein